MRKREAIILMIVLTAFFATVISAPSNIESAKQQITPLIQSFPSRPKHSDFGSFTKFLGDVAMWVESVAVHETEWYWSQTSQALIPRAYASGGIEYDSNCVGNGASSSINCSLNHAANVFILIAVIIDGSSHRATLSSITVGGLPTFIINVQGEGPFILYYYAVNSYEASDDSVVANFTGAHSNEAMIAASFTGVSATTNSYNSYAATPPSSASSSNVTVVAGESARRLINVIGIASAATITPGSSQTGIAEETRSTIGVEMNYEDTGSQATLTGSWSGSVTQTSMGLALLQAVNQVFTSPGADGVNNTSTGSISNASSGTISGFHLSAASVCIIGVSILNSSSQTVTSIAGTNNAFSASNFTLLTAQNNANNIRTELWYLFIPGSQTSAITVTLSASANAVMAAACFDNARGAELFEGQTAGTGNSGTEASGNVGGANTSGRRIILVAGVAAGSTPTGSQGVDLVGTNANSVGIDLNYLDSSSTTNMQATSTSGPWAAIAVALLPLQITVDASCTATGASATSLSCSLNHSNNVLIVIWAGNAGSDTVSGVTVAGNSATLFMSQANGTAATIALFYYYASTAANDSVVATYANHNNNESLAVYSLLGTTSIPPFFNAAHPCAGACYTATMGSAYCGAGTPTAEGETNRYELQGTEINSAVAVSQGNGFDVAYVTGNSNTLDADAVYDGYASLTMQEWLSASASCESIALAVLPPTPPTIALSPTSGSGGANVTVSGSNFAAGDTGCSVLSSPIGLVSSAECAMSSGVVSGSFTVASEASGTYTVVVTGTTGDLASATFTAIPVTTSTTSSVTVTSSLTTTSSTSATTSLSSTFTATSTLPATTLSPVVTRTVSTTTTTTGSVVGTSTTTFTSILSTATSSSSTTLSTGRTTMLTATTTIGTATTTSTSSATSFSTTTVAGTVTVSQKDTFTVFLTTIIQRLLKFANEVLKLLGARPVVTPKGEKVIRVIKTVK